MEDGVLRQKLRLFSEQMEGDINSPENMGVIPRSVHAIFDYLEGIRADYTVRTSFLELYNEVKPCLHCHHDLFGTPCMWYSL